MRIFSDFDGTASDHPEIMALAQAIVTGRSWQQAKGLYEEAGRIDIPVFFNPKDQKDIELMDIVLHKANIINKAGCEKFYEDIPKEAEMLRLLCPSTKIILVKEGVTYI